MWFLNHTSSDRGRPFVHLLCSYQCHDLYAIYALPLAFLNNPFSCFPLSFIAVMLPRFVLYIYLTLLCITACYIVLSSHSIVGHKPSFTISQVRGLLVLHRSHSSYHCAFSFHCWHDQRFWVLIVYPLSTLFYSIDNVTDIMEYASYTKMKSKRITATMDRGSASGGSK